MISLNVYEIIMQIVNFLILLFLMNKFLIKPLSQFLEKRAKSIEDNINKAEAAKVDAEKLLQEQKETLKEARVEAKEIRKKTEDASKREHDLILSDAKKEAEMVMTQAKKEIDLTMTKAKKDLLSEIGDLVVMLSESILKRKIERKDREEIVSDSMNKLS